MPLPVAYVGYCVTVQLPLPSPTVTDPAPTLSVVSDRNTAPVTDSRGFAAMPVAAGGILRVGNPGNKGGTGRTPSALRAQLRGSLADRIGIIEAVADSESATNSDRLKAVELLARYGLGEETTLTAGQVQSLTDAELDALADGRELPQRRIPDAT